MTALIFKKNLSQRNKYYITERQIILEEGALANQACCLFSDSSMLRLFPSFQRVQTLLLPQAFPVNPQCPWDEMSRDPRETGRAHSWKGSP